MNLLRVSEKGLSTPEIKDEQGEVLFPEKHGEEALKLAETISVVCSIYSAHLEDYKSKNQ